MPPKKYLTYDPNSGRLTQQAGTVLSGGAASGGNLIALDDSGHIDTSLLPAGGNMINPMTAAGDMIVGDIDQVTNLATLALGAVATVSSSYHGSPATAAIDENDATRWDSASPVAGQWLQVDLGAAKAVGGFRLYQYAWTDEGGSNLLLRESLSGSGRGGAAVQLPIEAGLVHLSRFSDRLRAVLPPLEPSWRRNDGRRDWGLVLVRES